MANIAVIGALGATGRQVCRAAIARGLQVTAIDRTPPDRRQSEAAVDFRQADVLKDDLAPLIAGSVAVISALGLPYTVSNALRPPPLYTRGTANVAAAMRRTGIRRLAVVSAAFVVHQPALPAWFALTAVPALHAILEEMRAMERAIAADDALDWTIARPGWLLDAPGLGTLVANDARLAPGAFRCREEDLARFLVDIVVDGNFIGRPPAVGAPDTAITESPLALFGGLAAAAARLQSPMTRSEPDGQA